MHSDGWLFVRMRYVNNQPIKSKLSKVFDQSKHPTHVRYYSVRKVLKLGSKY